MTSKRYWAHRAEARMSWYMRQSEAVAKDLERVYSGVYQQINEDSKAIMQTFQGVHGLSEAEAKALLKVVTGKDAPSKLKEILKKTKDPKKAAELKTLLDSPAYKYRIGRLQKVLDNVDGMAKDVYGVELSRTTRHYRDLFDEAYMRSMFDVQRGTGIGFSFAAVDSKTVDAVLAYNWSDEHYSSRIWGHCSKMAETVKDELLIGVLTRRSWRKTANNIAQRCGVGAFEARRLVRTESAAIASRAEQAMYEEADIEKYEFLATLDNRTSEECQKLDGKVFAVKDGKIGVNMPPMHAFCRSTTVAYFDDEVIEGLQRRARDPETGKTYTVPQDMTYKEWKGSLTKDEENGIIKANTGRKAKPKSKKTTAAPVETIPSEIELVLEEETVDSIVSAPREIPQPTAFQAGSKGFSDEAKTRLFQTECILADNRYETAVVYDKSGKVIFKKKGDADSVTFDAKEKQLMKGAVVTHNHPNGTCFSPADIHMFKKRGIAEMRASTKLRHFSMRAPDKWPPGIKSFKDIEARYYAIDKEISRKYIPIAAENGVPVWCYDVDIQMDVMRQLSKEMGFIFEVEDIL